MTSRRPSDDAQGDLESLMRAGQDAMKQFDDTLVSVAGVGPKDRVADALIFESLSPR
jgi:hypothetical protein